nr:PEGA domain-containing protein [Deltaproteobacteria bacterium]
IHSSARHVAEWITRFAQPGDQWVRTSGPQSSRNQLPLPAERATSVQRPRTPSSSPPGKLQRSPEQQKLATEVWGEEIPLATSSARLPAMGAPDFSMPNRMSSPLTASVPPLIQQPLANVPMYTPTQHPAPAAKSNNKAMVILAALAIIAGILAAVLVLKKREPDVADKPVVAAMGPVRFVVEPATAAIDVDGNAATSDMQLPAGEHAVTIKQPGYKPWRRSITVRAGESQTINVTLERGTAHVSVDSDPRGLPIHVDGKPTGHKTPANFDIAAGTHELSVKSPSGEVWTEELIATVDGKHTFTAMLRTKPATESASNDRKPPPKKAERDKKPPPEVVAEVKPDPLPEPVKPPEKPPEVVKPLPAPPVKPAQPARTPVVAAGAVTKLSGEIPKLKSEGGESNGDAFVKMCIDESGKVTSVKVVKTTGATATDLQSALATWRYKPYTNKDGQASPVRFPLSLRLVFKRAD